MGQLIGVQTRHAELAKALEHVALASGDSSGQSDLQHDFGRLGMAAALDASSFLCSQERVLQEHRNSQWTDAAGNWAQRAGHLFD